jgi:predicted transposase YbfD/YdcC
MKKTTPTISEHFANIQDPRIFGKNRHLLQDILVIAICSVVSGGTGWEHMELFGKAKHGWFQSFLELPNGVPGHDTFRRVISRINPQVFQECFVSWVQSVAEVADGQIIPIDGKTLRRSYDSSSNMAAIHMVSAWSAENKLVLGQVKTDAKSNEITAIPELLKILDIKGCIVTIDAMGCQRKIADQIVNQGGDYVLGLKGNQGSLLDAVEKVFATADEETLNSDAFDFFQTEEKNRGRYEVRTHMTTSTFELPMSSKWKGLKTAVLVYSEKEENGVKSTDIRYYISSLDNNAELIAKAVRSHWGIENSLHWVLDVTFREDECRIRKGHGPENFAILRHIARNLLQQESSKKSIKQKQLRAGWDERYLGKVLF